MHEVSYMKDYIKLQNAVSWKNEAFVKKILDGNKDLNVMFDDGVLLQMSIDNGSNSIVQVLLDYFKVNQLNKHQIGSKEYNNLHNQLTEILENLIEEIELSPEIKKVLSPYVDFEGSVDSREHDFDEFDLQLPISFENEQNHEITTSGNIIEHTNSTEFVS